jgi:hypothetical protein
LGSQLVGTFGKRWAVRMIELGMEPFGDSRNKFRPIAQHDDIQRPVTPYPRRMSAPCVARLAAIGVRIEIGRD